MTILRSFKGFRPKREYAKLIACRPYDVLSSGEARIEAKDNPYSFLHVIKPEIDLPPDTDPYAAEVYRKGRENLQKFIDEGILFQEETRGLYVYAQTFRERTQYGLVGCASVLDYMNNNIRRHELTRPDKEEDRKNLIRATDFNTEPVFFAHPPHEGIDDAVRGVIRAEPEYRFTTDDGIEHVFWVISDERTMQSIEEIFATEIPFVYVADGHHRTAAAAMVGNERRHGNPDHTGKEEYNYFLAVVFPTDQLNILDYNRVVSDLNGLTGGEFLQKLEPSFLISCKDHKIYHPTEKHNISMYLEGRWYSLSARKHTYNDEDPIGCLDVTILSKEILDPILGITDLRKSERIDFIGGIRGLEELKKLVDSGQMAVAFALYPVSMEQLMEIADTENIMPPKTTWFEPKLRSGLVLHHLE